MKWTSEEIEFLKNNYPKNGSHYCSKKLSRTQKSILKKAAKLGLKVDRKIRNQLTSKSLLGITKPTLCKVNADNFIKNQSIHVCYFLGLLWADGYLINSNNNKHTIRLEILKDDYEQIKQNISKTGEWTQTLRERKNRRPIIRLSTSNLALYKFLFSLDYKRKSFIAPSAIFKILNDEQIRYWFQGYFDGDGCFYYNEKNNCTQMSIAGSFQQNWDPILDFLNKKNIKFNIIRRINKNNNKSSCIRSANRSEILKFGNFIYPNVIGFSRKYKKFKIIQNLLRMS